MSNATTTESDKPGAGLNWRQRKKAVLRRKQLVNGYTAMLGGRITEIQRRDVERAVDLVMLADQTRARALKGEAVRIEDLTKLEIAADKAIRRLCLPAAGKPAPSGDAWREFLAGHGSEGGE